MLNKAGFEPIPNRGKGSHAIYQYPGTTIRVNLPGKDGADDTPYMQATSHPLPVVKPIFA